MGQVCHGSAMPPPRSQGWPQHAMMLTELPERRHRFEPDGGGIKFTNRSCDAGAFNQIFDRVCREQET